MGLILRPLRIVGWSKTLTKRPRIILSEKRDIPVLGFLWRWKLVSTRALHAVHFKNCSLITAYQRLLKLEKAGFIKCICNEMGQDFHWTLAKQGFAAISSLLPPLREVGFRSEHTRHDAIVTAFHLGDWLLERPKEVDLFSEQQLRRYAFESMPSWIPTPDLHRPDGYWSLTQRNGSTLVAIEVELGQKSHSFYQGVADFYEHEESIFRILWLVELPLSGRAIQSSLAKLKRRRADIHNFINLAHFKKHGWGAMIQRGPESGMTIRAFLESRLNHEVPKPLLNRSYEVRTPLLLDTRKSLGKPGFCRPGIPPQVP